MRRSSDNSVIIISEEAAKKYFDKKDKTPIKDEHLIVQKAREHLRKHGMSICRRTQKRERFERC